MRKLFFNENNLHSEVLQGFREKNEKDVGVCNERRDMRRRFIF